MEQEAEAFAIAEEATKTLQQAREAVQKARQARGYFPLGGKGSPSSSAKRPSSGKGRGFRPPGKGPWSLHCLWPPWASLLRVPFEIERKGLLWEAIRQGSKGFKGKGIPPTLAMRRCSPSRLLRSRKTRARATWSALPLCSRVTEPSRARFGPAR